MKIRSGLVSNSSSSCFILNKSHPLVEEWLKSTEYVELPEDLNRATALAIGRDAKEYAERWLELAEWERDDPSALGNWIMTWYHHLGENLVFVRESDEGIGEYLSKPVPLSCVIAEMEYH